MSNGRIDASTFPIPGTSWTNYYMRAGEGLSTSPPSLTESPSDSYASGSRRQSWSYQAGPAFGPPFTTADGPDELRYATEPFTKPTAIVGPITATLNLSATTVDTELFVHPVTYTADS